MRDSELQWVILVSMENVELGACHCCPFVGDVHQKGRGSSIYSFQSRQEGQRVQVVVSVVLNLS
jgi:hypothetical protein